jgi:hypothetical protein
MDFNLQSVLASKAFWHKAQYQTIPTPTYTQSFLFSYNFFGAFPPYPYLEYQFLTQAQIFMYFEIVTKT